MPRQDDSEREGLVTKKKTSGLTSGGTFDNNIGPAHHITSVERMNDDCGSGDGSGDEFTLTRQLSAVFFDKWQMKMLLIAVPFAVIGWKLDWADSVLFTCSFLGLIPLAALLGDFTEDICKRTNDVIGALVNVTFGNATELIISVCALRAGLLELIKFSLIGSILGNMLLVLGTAFVVGGIDRQMMIFNADAANTYAPLLTLSVLGFVIPSGYTWMNEDPSSHAVRVASEDSLAVSREVAVVACLVYVGYMFFQLHTHKTVFDSIADEDDEEEDGPVFSFAFGLVGIAIVALLISLLSDILVGSITGAAVQLGLPTQFIGIILVPIVGNAAEHASAVLMAKKQKLDIAVGVAMGSSIQIALFVMPFLVLCGWVVDIPLDMNFHPFPTALLFISVTVVSSTTQDGKTNWLEGMMLVSAYIMVALTFLHGKISME